MARRAEAGITGATSGPELDPEDLEDADGVVLERGFELEDVRFTADASLAEADAPYGHLTRALLEGVQLGGARLRGVTMRNVVAQSIDGSRLDCMQGVADRVEFAGCRMTGVELAESELREVAFRDCKLDYANFRNATLSGVTFEDCVLTDADFGAAKLDNVRFVRCELREVEFANARMRDVDMRGSDLSVRGAATSLRGAVVTPLQLMELAPVLAAEAGIRVEE
jgi:uncharacterized protein YjbI with pentapeptide repeats